MYQTKFENEHLIVELAAHEDGDGRLLMARATASERNANEAEPPLRLAVVIDRSGSMSGTKLEVARESASRLVDHLRSEDRIAAVTYDDEIDVLFPLSPPSRGLRSLIDRIRPGGSTNLYGGWLTGAKLLAGGGRVILLSDGLANAGRYQDALQLSQHAKRSYERYGVSTSTIGIGDDYDEALMAGMAREGAGAHYYAHNSESILEAFKRERFLAASLAVAGARIELGDRVLRIGQLLEGESKVVVMRISELPVDATLAYMDAKSESKTRVSLEVPTSFENVPLATAVLLDQEAAEAMDRAADVRSQDDASRKKADLRTILLRATNHALHDDEPLRTTRVLIESALGQLEQLASHYSERAAREARKYASQTSHNLREKTRAYSEDPLQAAVFRQSIATLYASAPSGQEPDPTALALRPIEYWRNFPAVPLSWDGHHLLVGLTDPMDGFAKHRLETELNCRIRTDKRYWTIEEIAQALQ